LLLAAGLAARAVNLLLLAAGAVNAIGRLRFSDAFGRL